MQARLLDIYWYIITADGMDGSLLFAKDGLTDTMYMLHKLVSQYTRWQDATRGEAWSDHSSEAEFFEMVADRQKAAG